MALDFPAAPQVGDSYASPGAERSWTWDGTAWNLNVESLDQSIADLVQNQASQTSNALDLIYIREDGSDADNLLRVGHYYLWVDPAGRLRIKPDVPPADINADGIVVGDQTVTPPNPF